MLDPALVNANKTFAEPLPQSASIPVVLISGDGIGPEISWAARRVISVACPQIDWIDAPAGAAVMDKGVVTGLPPETLEMIEEAGVVLKGPLATPQGSGGKSANVTLRKLYELYGNIRPIRSLPGLKGPYAGRDIDFTIVRENVEDLYAGIEHMQTPDVAQCLKLISRKGSEKIAHLAFALARAEHKDSVHCATKSNIMKLTEGLFQRSFEAVAERYPDIDAHHMIVDNCAHQMVMRPEQFDVVATTNMNGDILSDLAAGLVGGLGLVPSANVGAEMAMFEAVHGSAPDIAGTGKANPTALILAGAMMLRHLGKALAAARIEAAVKACYAMQEDLPVDVAGPGQAGSTQAFTDRLLDALSDVPNTAEDDDLAGELTSHMEAMPVREARVERRFDGVDVFVEWSGSVEALAHSMRNAAALGAFRLSMISNRGTIVWPKRTAHTDTVSHWRCRFRAVPMASDAEQRIHDLLYAIGERMRWMHVEKLEGHDGAPAYALAQGEASAAKTNRREERLQ